MKTARRKYCCRVSQANTGAIMRGIRYWTVGVAMALLLTACGGGGLSEEEVAEYMEPLTAAHDELLNWQFRVEGGLTYGDIISDWPDTSAAVRGDLDRFDAGDVPESEQCDAGVYALSIALAHDGWGQVRQSIRDYIYEDGPEDAVGDELEDTMLLMDVTESAREKALRPGDDCGSFDTDEGSDG
jgi:hypothetical protein